MNYEKLEEGFKLKRRIDNYEDILRQIDKFKKHNIGDLIIDEKGNARLLNVDVKLGDECFTLDKVIAYEFIEFIKEIVKEKLIQTESEFREL